MHEKEKGEWDLHWRLLVGNTADITGCFEFVEGEEYRHPPAGLRLTIDSKGAAEGAIEFLLESFYLGGEGEIAKALNKVGHNSAFPGGKDLSR